MANGTVFRLTSKGGARGGGNTWNFMNSMKFQGISGVRRFHSAGGPAGRLAFRLLPEGHLGFCREGGMVCPRIGRTGPY